MYFLRGGVMYLLGCSGIQHWSVYKLSTGSCGKQGALHPKPHAFRHMSQNSPNEQLFQNRQSITKSQNLQQNPLTAFVPI